MAPRLGDPAPDLVRLPFVMDRSGLRDAGAARRIIRMAGGFQIGRRWQVRLADPIAWEDE